MSITPELLALFNEMLIYDNYNNCISIIVKSAKTGPKLSWNIIQGCETVKFKLKSIQYLSNSGVVDLNHLKLLRHSMVNVFMDYVWNTQQNLYNREKLFSGSNLGFLGSTSLFLTLTTKGVSLFEDVNLLKYVELENTLISEKKFVGGIGCQYVSAIKTLIDNEDLFKMKDVFKYSNYMKFSSSLYSEILKNVSESTQKLVECGYLDTTIADLSTYIKYYTYIFSQNSGFTNEVFESRILDFQKWLLNRGYYDPNLNELFRITKNVEISVDSLTQRPTVNLSFIFVDANTLQKYPISNLKNLNDLVGLLEKSEKFQILNEEDILELKKKFKLEFK